MTLRRIPACGQFRPRHCGARHRRVCPKRDILTHGDYVHRKHQVDVAKQLFSAMGYPDETLPGNAVKSDREPNSDFVRYVGFAD